MDHLLQKIHNGDCISGMQSLPEGSIDLVFADPPFNIGYKYDVYEDRLAADEYLKWSSEWIKAAWRALKPTGSFWLAIGDDFAAELKIESLKAGFHCRSWVVWYYTFGVNCSRKFTRSHTHLFHFVKDRENFTFRVEDPSNRVPSARQLVYLDKRADGKGRLPDDTWIIPPVIPAELTSRINEELQHLYVPGPDRTQSFTLRPQDLQSRFQKSEDVWYFPRVAGTFQERAGFHGCQMPEQLLGRIIRTCSERNEIVMDPFAGSASTLIVAKKLGRRFVGFELSPEYSRAGTDRLMAVRFGDPLVGSAEPTMSAPRTDPTGNRPKQPNAKAKPKAKSVQNSLFDDAAIEENHIESIRNAVEECISEIFFQIHDGLTEDIVIADPEVNAMFIEGCQKLGLPGDPRTWNTILLQRRQAGFHANLDYRPRQAPDLHAAATYLFASEIAWSQLLLSEKADSLHEILCDPSLCSEFDRLAATLAPGFTPFEYRWAALKLLEHSPTARSRGKLLAASRRFGTTYPLATLSQDNAPDQQGVYILRETDAVLYVGESPNLRDFSRSLTDGYAAGHWKTVGNGDLSVQFFPADLLSAGTLAWTSRLATQLKSRLNTPEIVRPEK